jgi:hypothetical protein
MSTVTKMRTTVAFLAENKTERFLRTRAIRQRLLKGEGARENTQCRGAIAAPGFIVSLFIWRLRFAKTPLDARGGG